MVISVDPGETSGISYWSDKGEFVEKEMLTQEELFDKIEKL